MVISVPRPEYPVAAMSAVVGVLEGSLNDSLKAIETSDKARTSVLRSSLNVARLRCVPDPEAVMLETWESWVLAMTRQEFIHLFTPVSDPQRNRTSEPKSLRFQ
ncbi:hypothetical protein SCYAM73S_05664 [Streptomyces cyaneofuscatus]|nr:hypothetical protein STIB_18750 [Streptomyces sp. IB2014 011-1]